MGVLNVTPDSFSDGGRYLDPDAAVAHGEELAEAGAALVDVGGESTRPGAEPVGEAEERRRVVGVVERLASRAIAVSIDTTKAAVAAAALDAGAVLVNDISGATYDPAMLDTVVMRDAGIVVGHVQGEPPTMQAAPHYADVVAEVGDALATRVDAARRAGVRADAILADPGIGFGKTAEHNLELLAALAQLRDHAGAPLVVGASRKRFLTPFAGRESIAGRDDATLAVTVWAFTQGVAVVRVHDLVPSWRAARLLGVMERAAPAGAR